MDIANRILAMNKHVIVGLVGLALIFSTVMSAAGVQAGTTTKIESSSADASVARYRGTIVEDVKMRGTKINNQNCRWVSGGWNSGRTARGGLVWFKETKRTKICKNDRSPTGWIKVAGGKTGRNCGNPFKPRGGAPGRVLQGPVVKVRNLSNINVNVRAQANVVVRAERVCPDGAKLAGRAGARAGSRVRANQSLVVQANGRVNQIEAIMKQRMVAAAKARAVAKISITCPPERAAEPKEKEPAAPTPEKPEEPEAPITQPRLELEPAPAPEPEVVPVAEEEVTFQPAGKAAPEALPKAGAPALVGAFLGISSLSSALYQVILRRFLA